MLRIQQFNVNQHNESLKQAFNEIFSISEIQYFDEEWNYDMSYVCTDRHNSVQGFILVKTSQATYEIGYLGIMPRYRNKSYAKRLIEMVKNKVGTEGVFLSVFNSNFAATNLYKNAGFEITDTRPNTSGELVSTYIWKAIKNCYHCRKPLTSNDIILEDTPVSVSMTPYGLKNVYSQEAVCYNCRTRVES